MNAFEKLNRERKVRRMMDRLAAVAPEGQPLTRVLDRMTPAERDLLDRAANAGKPASADTWEAFRAACVERDEVRACIARIPESAFVGGEPRSEWERRRSG